MSKGWSLFVTVVMLLAGVRSPALGGSNDDSVGYLRFGHFAADAASVEIYLGGDLVVPGLASGEVTSWRAIAARDVVVSVIVNATDESLSLSLSLAVDRWLTVALIRAEGGALALRAIEEDYTPLADDESRLTLLYAVGIPRTVDVRLSDVPAARLDAYEAVVLSNAQAGVYDLTLIRSGTSTPAYFFPGIVLEPQTNHLIVITGALGDASLINIPTPVSAASRASGQPGNGITLVRAAHLSSGTPPVDVYINGELFELGTLRFPEFSSWQAYPAGTYRLAVTLAGEPLSEALLGPLDVTLDEGVYTNLFIIGSLANNTLQLHRVAENFTPLGQNTARISFLNAYPGTGSVSVLLGNGNRLIEQLGYPGFFGTNDGFTQVILPSGVYDFDIVQDGTQQRLARLESRNLLPSRNYLIALINADPAFFLTFTDISEAVDMMEATLTP